MSPLGLKEVITASCAEGLETDFLCTPPHPHSNTSHVLKCIHCVSRYLTCRRYYSLRGQKCQQRVRNHVATGNREPNYSAQVV